MSIKPLTLPTWLATELLDAGIGGKLWTDGADWTVVADQEDGTGRWESIHSLVIKRCTDGMHFAASYRRGLTEHQDTQPWEYETEVTFEHVVPVTRTVTEYITPGAAEFRAALTAAGTDVPA